MQIIKRKVDSNLHLHRLQGGVEALFDHMLCGHALIAYRKQNGEFRLVKATLVHYRGDFHKEFDPGKIDGAVVHWDVEQQGWITFQVENFLEWRLVI